jgi:F-type H+-transporting ATPase subunit gamma
MFTQRLVREAPKPLVKGARNMATAQALRLRIRSVQTLVKITSAKKTIAVVKLNRARAQLDKARIFANSMGHFFEQPNDETEKPLYLPISADKGLCGGINSSIARATRDIINSHGPAGKAGQIFCVGEKAKQTLERSFAKIMNSCIAEPGGNQLPSFTQVGIICDHWNSIEHDKTFLYFQRFKSMIAYDTTLVKYDSWENMSKDLSAFNHYEIEGDPDTLQNLNEFSKACNMYRYMYETEASMLSATMQAMDSSSKNAAEMLDDLTLLLNRTRQAKITTELSEISAGGMAVQAQE